MCTRTGIEEVAQNWDERHVLELGWNMCTGIGIKHVYRNWDYICVQKLGLNMCTGTGIKHVYQGVQGACRRCGSKACLIYKQSMMTKICNIMTKRTSSFILCLPGTSHGLATGQIMLIPAPHSVCFLWPHLPQQSQFHFLSPSTSVKVPVSVYFSILLIFYHSFFCLIIFC